AGKSMRGSISRLATRGQVWLHHLGGAARKSRRQDCKRRHRSARRSKCRNAGGPSKFLYADRQECRKALEHEGFDAQSTIFETRLVEWNVPAPQYLFGAERDAGV